MLRSIGDFISEIVGGERAPDRFDETDYRLASAALLVHVVTSDADFSESEREKVREVLAQRFDLAAEDADALVESALKADREAVDLYQFTSVLNRSCDEEARRKIVEMMFQVAYADGELSEFEDNIVWRASELLHVPSRERVTLRQQVRETSRDGEN